MDTVNNVVGKYSVAETGSWTYQPFPDTGQRLSYTNNKQYESTFRRSAKQIYGQDAHYTRLPRSYTKLGMNGAELPDNAAFVDDGGPWVMIRDNVTGLIWEIKTKVNQNDTYNWQDAQDVFITGLNESNFGGFSDWRMADVKELYSLIDRFDYLGRFIDKKWFPNTEMTSYWSSTPNVYKNNCVWVVDFSDSCDNPKNKTDSNHIRAVRGGQFRILDNFIVNGDGTVTDPNTGLMWQEETAPGDFIWKDALVYSENLTLAGYSDWRLPNINELKTIVDYTRYDLAVDVALKNTHVDMELNKKIGKATGYLSSTTCMENHSLACYLDFQYGFSGQAIKTVRRGGRVRAVRAGYSTIKPFGSLTVSIEPPKSLSAGAQWRRAGTNFWYNSNATERNLPVGRYTIEFKDVNRFNKPENVTVNISANQTNIVSNPKVNRPIPRTGQTKCYNNENEIICPQPGEPFYGQDPQYPQWPPSYTKLGRCGFELTVDAASVDDGGLWMMTRDNVTGLIWEIKTQANKDDKYNWQRAQDDFVVELNHKKYGGFNDWRMPTILELYLLFNKGLASPDLDAAWFPNVVDFSFWSSTQSAYRPDHAWSARSSRTTINEIRSKDNSMHILAVRGGNSQAVIAFQSHGDGTFSDPNTGLMWQQDTAPGKYNWQDALAYAENLTLANHTDWRLPNINELNSILDYEKINSVENESGFYWSSTSTTCKYFLSHTSTAYRVNLRSGTTFVDNRPNSHYVRAVRC